MLGFLGRSYTLYSTQRCLKSCSYISFNFPVRVTSRVYPETYYLSAGFLCWQRPPVLAGCVHLKDLRPVSQWSAPQSGSSLTLLCALWGTIDAELPL